MSAGAMMKSSLEFANVLPIHALTQLVGKVDQVRMVAERPGKVMSSDFLSQVLKATSGAATIREAKDPRFEQMTMSREMTRSALPPLRAQLTESLGTFAPRDANRQLANLLMAGEAATRACSSGAVAGMTTLKEAMLHPFELRRVEFQVGAPQDARPGDLFVYRFAQIAENMVLGGYTVVVQVTR
jgi:hypothetical protein